MNRTTAQESNKTIILLPPRPRLVLRLGFTGRKELTDHERRNLEAGLLQVCETIVKRLATIAPGVPVRGDREFRVAEFYSKERPLVRLVTGLCEGADALAANVLKCVAVAPNACDDSNSPRVANIKDGETRYLETELAAVLPFDVASYRRSRPDWFLPEFDRQLQACKWVIELDGIYDKPDPATTFADVRRARGYRAQGAFLLRQSDILIAAANPDDSGKAGGTLETVREAIAFELPVVFIHTGNGAVYLIAPNEDMHSVLAEPPPDDAARNEGLTSWVDHLTADPDRTIPPAHHAAETHEHGDHVLIEFFSDAKTPPTNAGKRRSTWREWIWAKVENMFRSGPSSKSDPPLAPYDAFRKRATSLNYHYSGLYRGAFVLNYGLAIVAVVLAAAGLVLLGTAGHCSVGRDIATLLERAGYDPTEVAVSPAPRPWLLPVLLTLAFSKLLILTFIARNTRRANREKWNDRAVDYRYLAERLRAMFYLPQAGSFQPPAATPPQFASRVARQSSVDWLFDAIVRSVSPAELDAARETAIEVPGGRTLTVSKLLRINPVETASRVRDNWVNEQANYHERNWMTMHTFGHRLERAARWLGLIVVGVVFIDFLLIVGELADSFPHEWTPVVKAATPWLVFVSAVLPAVVAALSGIRSQSECGRLSERSAVMRILLRGRIHKQGPPDGPASAPEGRYALADELVRRIEAATSDPTGNVGSWSHDALRLTERIATDFVQEAAEWTVLYAKEVSDPG